MCDPVILTCPRCGYAPTAQRLAGAVEKMLSDGGYVDDLRNELDLYRMSAAAHRRHDMALGELIDLAEGLANRAQDVVDLAEGDPSWDLRLLKENISRFWDKSGEIWPAPEKETRP